MLNQNNNRNDFMDMLNIFSFVLGAMNLNENMTQGDKQELMTQFDTKTNQLLREIHEHLELQDKKLDKILKNMEA